MLKVDGFVLHDQHRQSKLEHDQWLADIARWREEYRQAMAMLEEVKAVWNQSEAALEEHARRIWAHEQHLERHERMFQEEGWSADAVEDDATVAEHEGFEAVHAEARRFHAQMQQLHSGVMAEVLELLKVTHPGSVVLETH